jgi:hypothetical protein
MANKTMDEQIRLHAYYLWEADGCPEGRAHDYWQKARTLLEKQHAASAAPIDEASAVELIVEKAAKKPAKSKAAATTPAKKGVKVTKTDGKDAAKPLKKEAKESRRKICCGEGGIQDGCTQDGCSKACGSHHREI